MTGKTQTLLVK